MHKIKEGKKLSKEEGKNFLQNKIFWIIPIIFLVIIMFIIIIFFPEVKKFRFRFAEAEIEIERVSPEAAHEKIEIIEKKEVQKELTEKEVSTAVEKGPPPPPPNYMKIFKEDNR